MSLSPLQIEVLRYAHVYDFTKVPLNLLQERVTWASHTCRLLGYFGND